jgi:hypothetical protein
VLAKMIARFEPALRQGLREAERHYCDVHFPYARQILLSKPQVRSYHINRVLRQLDLAGGWNQRPTAWRFVVLTFDPARGLEFDSETAGRIANDHLNFLRCLRSTPVTERVTLDRLNKQTVLQKYIIEMDCGRQPQDDAPQIVRDIECLVTEAAAELTGIRLVRCNRVLQEFAAESIEEEGQRATGRALPTTDKLGYVEVYADDEYWGDALFAVPEVLCRIQRTGLQVNTYKVEERCGVDRIAAQPISK